MGLIVGIGGGEISERGTLEIDKLIISSSGKKNPSVLFIPAASGDSEGYCNAFSEYYSSLGAEVQFLKLVSQKLSENEITNLIESSDIIYVGGGNTIKLIEAFESYNLATKFKEVFHSTSKVLCGLSAGCLCWFEWGMSDSIPGKWTFVECLGLVKGVASVGFLRNDNRSEIFEKEYASYSKTGYGLPDACAIIINSEGDVKHHGEIKIFI